MSDEVFLKAWAVALEKHGTNTKVKDIWAISEALENELEKEQGND